MKITTISVALLALPFFSAPALDVYALDEESSTGAEGICTVENSHNLDTITPLDFLEKLRIEDESLDNESKVRIGKLPRGWVKNSDLSALVEILDSNEPCKRVYRGPCSSFRGIGNSTIGNEAAYLIDFYRTGYYSSGMGSFELNKEKLKAWYRNKHNNPHHES